jgi:hypothetical protein
VRLVFGSLAVFSLHGVYYKYFVGPVKLLVLERAVARFAVLHARCVSHHFLAGFGRFESQASGVSLNRAESRFGHLQGVFPFPVLFHRTSEGFEVVGNLIERTLGKVVLVALGVDHDIATDARFVLVKDVQPVERTSHVGEIAEFVSFGSICPVVNHPGKLLSDRFMATGEDNVDVVSIRLYLYLCFHGRYYAGLASGVNVFRNNLSGVSPAVIEGIRPRLCPSRILFNPE